MSLLFNMLFRLVITFLPRSKHLLILENSYTNSSFWDNSLLGFKSESRFCKKNSLNFLKSHFCIVQGALLKVSIIFSEIFTMVFTTTHWDDLYHDNFFPLPSSSSSSSSSFFFFKSSTAWKQMKIFGSFKFISYSQIVMLNHQHTPITLKIYPEYEHFSLFPL